MYLTIACSVFISGCQPFALVQQATNTRARRPAYQAQGGATPITGSCMVHFKWDARVYERVQPRLPEVSRCKALFRSPKCSQYQLVSDTKLPQICCSARDVIINCGCVPGCCTLLKRRCMIQNQNDITQQTHNTIALKLTWIFPTCKCCMLV